MRFRLSPELNKHKIFLVKRSELEGRVDPAYNLALIENKISSSFPKHKIKGLCKALTGGTPSKANPTFWKGSIPWVSPKDMKSFYLSDAIDHITENAVKESSTNIVPKNSVLIVVRSGILQHTIPVSITTREMAINQDIKALIFNDSVLAAYPAYFIDVFQAKLLPLTVKHSTTVQSINTEQFDNLKIPVPPKEIQTQIVAKMDAAYAAKKQKEAEAQRLLDSIDDYLLGELGIILPEQEENTVLSRIFYRQASEVSGYRHDPSTYRQERLAASQSIGKGIYKTKPLYQVVSFNTNKTNDIDEGATYIGLENIESNTGKWIPTESKDSISSAAIFNADEILFPKLRPYLNKVFYSDTQGLCSTEFHVLHSKTENNEYVANFLRSKVVVAQTKHLMSGNTLPRLQFEDIKKLLIPCPPRGKQTEIAKHITQIRNQAQQLQQQAQAELEQAKQHVEVMILGGDAIKE